MKQRYKPKREQYGRRAYIGNMNGEEFFLKPIKWDCGHYWGGVYLEGLRPETEEVLKEIARDSEISDYYDTRNIPSHYLNEEKFREDCEDSWYERYDIQEQQERNGEVYYLGFGTHTHADSVLLNECNGDYQTALKVFDKLYIKEEDFKTLIEMLRKFYALKEFRQEKPGYKKAMAQAETILQEYEQFIQRLSELPTAEYWINPMQD